MVRLLLPEQLSRHILTRNPCHLSGVPTYRTHIQYVPQRPSLLPKTPRDFLDTLNTFRSRRKVDKAAGLEDYHNVWDVARSWGIDDELWDRAWNTLSGGESQRIALAIAFGLNTAEVLLLDGKCPC